MAVHSGFIRIRNRILHFIKTIFEAGQRFRLLIGLCEAVQHTEAEQYRCAGLGSYTIDIVDDVHPCSTHSF